MSKFSSFKSHQLITETWRKFLKESNGAWEEEEAEYKLGGGGPPIGARRSKSGHA